MSIKEEILNPLLDKYENSKHFLGEAKVNRRIKLDFNEEYKGYSVENIELKNIIHEAVFELVELDVLDFKWVKHEKGNIIDYVTLNLDNIDKAYKIISRKPKRDKLYEVNTKLIEAKGMIATQWIVDFLEDCIAEIQQKHKLPKRIPKDENVFERLIDTFIGLESIGDEELLERIFSRRYLGGSKIFEKYIRKRLSTIVKEYLLKGLELEEDEVLQSVGIVKSSSELLFCGALTVEINDNIIDFSVFPYGSSMNTYMIKDFKVKELLIDQILTIENKANYIEYIKNPDISNKLVIYLGGFYSPPKKRFLEKIYRYIKQNNKKVEIYHWGDIDLGGFQIFNHLRNTVLPTVRPYLMDKETLIENLEYADKFNMGYGKKLRKLLDCFEYKIFHEVIEYMLENRIKLEQEALLCT